MVTCTSVFRVIVGIPVKVDDQDNVELLEKEDLRDQVGNQDHR